MLETPFVSCPSAARRRFRVKHSFVRLLEERERAPLEERHIFSFGLALAAQSRGARLCTAGGIMYFLRLLVPRQSLLGELSLRRFKIMCCLRGGSLCSEMTELVEQSRVKTLVFLRTRTTTRAKSFVTVLAHYGPNASTVSLRAMQARIPTVQDCSHTRIRIEGLKRREYVSCLCSASN